MLILPSLATHLLECSCVCTHARVCILYHFQKTSSLSFSFVCSYGCIFSIYFAFISSISIGLVKTSPTCSKPDLSHSHPTQVFPSLKKRRDKDGATHDPSAPHPIAILLNCDLINLTRNFGLHCHRLKIAMIDTKPPLCEFRA